MNNFVSLEHIYKVYPNGIEAVHDFNLDIKKEEFIVIVGPSGCGKSTTLRMVAGLENISEGKLFIDGKLCNDETPKDRDIAMVFQSYSLYPHMSVKDNISFGIRMRKFSFPKLDKEGKQVYKVDKNQINKLEKENISLKKEKKTLDEDLKASLENKNDKFIKEKIASLKKRINSFEVKIAENIQTIEKLKINPSPVQIERKLTSQEIDEKVAKVAKILELEDYLKRKPAELSGGQRQRVALGRSIIRDAKVFLMDEPLSNLDAKLRGVMRSEIIKLHDDLHATIIYVTHDQTEAMTMASRIVVMKDGYIQQIGTPREVYQNPSNTFVANFIGSPAMNIIPAEIKDKKIVLPNKFSITLTSEEFQKFKVFYENQIKDCQTKLDLLNTDIEEILLANIPQLLNCWKSNKLSYQNIYKTVVSASKKPIQDFLKKLEINHKIALSNPSLTKEEVSNVNSLLSKEIKLISRRYNKLESYNNDLISKHLNENLLKEVSFNSFSLDYFLKESTYFNQKYNNSFLNELINNEKERFASLLSKIFLLLNSLNEIKGSELDYLLGILKAEKGILKTLQKENKEYLIKLFDELLINLENNIVKEEVGDKVKNFLDALNRVNTLSNADIRQIYFTALEIKGKNKNLDWIIEVVNKANALKKRTNVLRNEFLIESLIKSISNQFALYGSKNNNVLFGIRPEDIHPSDKFNKEKYGTLKGNFKVEISELLGKEYILHLGVNCPGKYLISQLPSEKPISAKDEVELILDRTKLHLFDPITGKLVF